MVNRIIDPYQFGDGMYHDGFLLGLHGFTTFGLMSCAAWHTHQSILFAPLVCRWDRGAKKSGRIWRTKRWAARPLSCKDVMSALACLETIEIYSNQRPQRHLWCCFGRFSWCVVRFLLLMMTSCCHDELFRHRWSSVTSVIVFPSVCQLLFPCRFTCA